METLQRKCKAICQRPSPYNKLKHVHMCATCGSSPVLNRASQMHLMYNKLFSFAVDDREEEKIITFEDSGAEYCKSGCSGWETSVHTAKVLEGFGFLGLPPLTSLPPLCIQSVSHFFVFGHSVIITPALLNISFIAPPSLSC